MGVFVSRGEVTAMESMERRMDAGSCEVGW